ncbi:MAG: NnrS family protein [Marinicella sp.]|nr:NnrS family protein [Xanthomonadales bacterium]
MNISIKKTARKAITQTNSLALWQLGFRPGFLLASVYAIISMLFWLMVQQGWSFSGLEHYTINYWHAHEMIFGYGLLVIAGFLLTAIKNWTGVQTLQGKGLMLFMLCWLLARVSVFVPDIPVIGLIALDCLFPLLLVYFVANPLLVAGNKRNYKMIFIVAVMALLNLGFHLSLFWKKNFLASQLLLLALMLVILLICVMAGRIFAMFSQNGVEHRYQAIVYPKVEQFLPITIILLVVTWVFFAEYKWLLCLLATINVFLHGLRLFGWYNVQIWKKPLVWVLHIGYVLLTLGFVFIAFSAFVPAIKYLAIHVFTVGAFGLITLGMMARVSLGHTGRNLHQPPRILFYCFFLLVISTLLRVFLPLFNVIPYSQVILLSGLLWILAFGLFFVRYLPVWLKPRIDGKPG